MQERKTILLNPAFKEGGVHLKEIKERHAVWLYPSTVGVMDNLLAVDNCKSRSEYIEKAVQFYSGYLTSLEKNEFIPELLQSSLSGMVDSSEERISRLLFKFSVELNMLMRIISTQYEFTEEYLDRLRGLAVEEVKQSSGTLTLKDINRSFDI